MKTGSRDLALTFAILAAFAYLARTLFFGGSSADLLAVWLSGVEFSQGHFDQIYPQVSGLFSMQPPENWLALARSNGHQGPIFPYIYPPLWAALMSPLTAATDFETFSSVARNVNLALIAATVLAAFRAAGFSGPMWSYFAISLPALSLTTPGLLALHENQPQILVSFLLVLTIERMHHKSYRLAGAALALAAALKVFPALFVIIWIINRQWRALTSFAIVGGALAAASIVIAGWPLNVLFIQQLVDISNTVLNTGYSYNLNAVIAHLFYDAELLYVDAVGHPLASARVAVGWDYLPKGLLWRALSTGALLVALIWAGFAILRDRAAQSTIWIFAIGAMALLGPISWPYYYIPLIVFLPVIVDRFGRAKGLIIMLIALLPSTLTVPRLVFLYANIPLAYVIT